ncbi:50S ribosomal protein L24 [Coxiella endosymbiont of Ornithodoros amblus]|uniref:50S ribosomal protein L24 n=1 Tax=Coxiella endosymbiont of Ornithodoros amblus TaxID=1656166 RepID=UPI00244E0A01|nr:50S ribosomal protein L24 [Coxiella endosymbiont of Ornithodoros amblus]MBW5802540.1 50S ribosomal protein L24 [Coxiella endosymbiont of Ornithodoros amblus]
MAIKKIKKDDTIILITGRDKGRQGKVLKVLPNRRLLIEGINLVNKHVKPNPNKNEQGGILERELSIHVSNVAIYNPASKKADRVGIKTLEDGSKVRIFKSNGEVIDV